MNNYPRDTVKENANCQPISETLYLKIMNEGSDVITGRLPEGDGSETLKWRRKLQNVRCSRRETILFYILKLLVFSPPMGYFKPIPPALTLVDFVKTKSTNSTDCFFHTRNNLYCSKVNTFLFHITFCESNVRESAEPILAAICKSYLKKLGERSKSSQHSRFINYWSFLST